MTRLQDWTIRYSAYIAERRSMPFAWGSNDCASFATNCIAAITGVDIVDKAYAGRKSEKDAARMIKRGGGLRAIADKAVGQSWSAMYAGVGDLVLFVLDGRETLGICNGDEAFAPGESGIVAVPMSAVIDCWRIG